MGSGRIRVAVAALLACACLPHAGHAQSAEVAIAICDINGQVGIAANAIDRVQATEDAINNCTIASGIAGCCKVEIATSRRCAAVAAEYNANGSSPYYSYVGSGTAQSADLASAIAMDRCGAQCTIIASPCSD